VSVELDTLSLGWGHATKGMVETVADKAQEVPSGGQTQNEARTRMHALSTCSADEAYKALASNAAGLNAQQVEVARQRYGSNVVHHAKRASVPKRLVRSFADPFTGILIVLAIISLVTDVILAAPGDKNPATVIIIVTMVLISGLLRFFQEGHSDAAVQELLDMIKVTCSVERAETGVSEIPLGELVVGDVVHVAAGDMIPADLRVVVSKDLTVSQGTLTGESVPVNKTAEAGSGEGSLTDQPDLVFMGSNVSSGGATCLVVATGVSTMLGEMSSQLSKAPAKTAFAKGIESVSWLLIRFMLVMVPAVLLINGFTKGDWLEALLFAISVAVGLTPEMLPMLVTTCLAKGAVSMSHKKVIIKKLDAIENLGSIDILCTDKTGTLTQNKVILERHLDLEGKPSTEVLRNAYLNSSFQTGLKNLMDHAIIEACARETPNDAKLDGIDERFEKVDEVPFDFNRRRMSVLVRGTDGHTRLITKGAVEEMLKASTSAKIAGEVVSLTDDIRSRVMSEAHRLADDGMRVLAVAEVDDPDYGEKLDADDEHDMTLLGYLAFLDPPKDSSAAALRSLADHGVTTKILTGDSDRVTCFICRQIGLPAENPLLGSDIEGMGDAELAERAETTTVFAKLSPSQKARVVSVLRTKGHAVGYMGDGVNDAAAMRASDAGISVDDAVDIARESADIILLEKDLGVLDAGIIEGRRTYANMIKYIKMTASSNFGNIFSVLVASAFLPFLPMAAVHLLLLNLVYDLCCTAIPWDNVDTEFIARPRKWDASSIGRFMAWMGPTSSVFDIMTYVILFFVVCPAVCGGPWASLDVAGQVLFVATFQAGWFVESMWTQTTVIHLIRTEKIPFVQSRASAPVFLGTILGGIFVTILPFTGIGAALGLASLPGFYFGWLVLIIGCYMLLETVVKKIYIKRYGELL